MIIETGISIIVVLLLGKSAIHLYRTVKARQAVQAVSLTDKLGESVITPWWDEGETVLEPQQPLETLDTVPCDHQEGFGCCIYCGWNCNDTWCKRCFPDD